MDRGFELFPDQASSVAPKVDALYLFLVGISAFFTVLIFLLIVFFALYYHRSLRRDRTIRTTRGLWMLEAAWIVIPLALTMISFVWGARLYFEIRTPPENPLEIQVIGKQWMWKIHHVQGRQEINELHVPVGVPVLLRMISEDVIHSFHLPEFRVKMDVLPDRYSMLWFEATKPGIYHLFCAEYCGTDHADMSGRVIAMPQADYASWLTGAVGTRADETGADLFRRYRCDTCHYTGRGARCPPLEGLYESQVQLEDGTSIQADETYLRESILRPAAKVRLGYRPLMPIYEGQLSEEQVFLLVEYIKGLAISPDEREPTESVTNGRQDESSADEAEPTPELNAPI